MADIFLSYSQKDKVRVKPLVDALEAEGWSVWWDRKTRPGETLTQVLDREIGAAMCMIAVWSEASVASDWVQEEAEDGRLRGRLISVRLDAVEIPRGFRRQQAADLTSWDGTSADQQLRLLIEGSQRRSRIRRRLNRGPRHRRLRHHREQHRVRTSLRKRRWVLSSLHPNRALPEPGCKPIRGRSRPRCCLWWADWRG